MLDRWEDCCANRIVENATVPLTSEISSLIKGFDFGQVHTLDIPRMLKDEHILPVLVKWFSYDPGEAPKGTVPNDVNSLAIMTP
jgi:hypothetical protein